MTGEYKEPPKEISWVAKTNKPGTPGFDRLDPDVVSGRFVKVNETNHPRLFEANDKVAKFFGVRRPAVYVDTTGSISLAYAYFDSEAIVVGKPELGERLGKTSMMPIGRRLRRRI